MFLRGNSAENSGGKGEFGELERGEGSLLVGMKVLGWGWMMGEVQYAF